MAGYCGHDNEPSVSINYEELLGYLRNIRFSRRTLLPAVVLVNKCARILKLTLKYKRKADI
jgi:hypothetical protein